MDPQHGDYATTKKRALSKIIVTRTTNTLTRVPPELSILVVVLCPSSGMFTKIKLFQSKYLDNFMHKIYLLDDLQTA